MDLIVNKHPQMINKVTKEDYVKNNALWNSGIASSEEMSSLYQTQPPSIIHGVTPNNGNIILDS